MGSGYYTPNTKLLEWLEKSKPTTPRTLTSANVGVSWRTYQSALAGNKVQEGTLEGIAKYYGLSDWRVLDNARGATINDLKKAQRQASAVETYNYKRWRISMAFEGTNPNLKQRQVFNELIALSEDGLNGFYKHSFLYEILVTKSTLLTVAERFLAGDFEDAEARDLLVKYDDKLYSSHSRSPFHGYLALAVERYGGVVPETDLNDLANDAFEETLHYLTAAEFSPCESVVRRFAYVLSTQVTQWRQAKFKVLESVDGPTDFFRALATTLQSKEHALSMLEAEQSIYTQLMRTAALVLHGNPGRYLLDPEDLVQRAIGIMIEQRFTFRAPDPETFYATAKIVMKRVLNDSWRSERIKWHFESLSNLSVTELGKVENEVDFLANEKLQAAMKGLRQDYQDLIKFKYFDGESIAEISANLGQSEAVVRGQLRRALDLLRALLDDGFDQQ
jgi:RNA polymerase sigma factor (sigma-70 family)